MSLSAHSLLDLYCIIGCACQCARSTQAVLQGACEASKGSVRSAEVAEPSDRVLLLATERRLGGAEVGP